MAAAASGGPPPKLGGRGSEISRFYAGRSVLVTGATGFMGKVLVEKLLRSCPDVHRIYLLVRPKGSQDVRSRLDELVNNCLFDHLRRDSPESLEKLRAVAGDIVEPGLGISTADEASLAQDVSVVFHSAATVKFDEALKLSVAMNVNGTKQLVQLCHKMHQLVALVHVSTAYCHCEKQHIEEVVYPSKTDPHKLIQCVEWMTDDMVNTVTPQLLGNKPNTYTYTKALAEQILAEESGKLPVAIVRPSIVTGSWKEPFPGWVDNVNGPTGLTIACGKGILRTVLCHRSKIADMVPVDVPINLMIAVAWHTATTRPNSLTVYNCTSGALNPFTWGDLQYWGHVSLIKNPMNDVLWYPGGSFKYNRVWNNVNKIILQYIPAHVMDLFAKLSGRKPVMMKIYNKLDRAVQSLEYFTTREWNFTNDNVLALWELLIPEDQRLFHFDIRQLEWPTYVGHYCMGMRKYVLKEDSSTLPQARRHLRKMYLVHRFTQFVMLLVFWRALMVRSEVARQLWSLLFSTVLRFCRLLPLGNGL